MEYDGREFHTSKVDKAHDEQRRRYLSDILGWRIVVCRMEDILGDDPSFEREVGALLGIEPLLPRMW